jgi:hypothetical protein
MLSQYVHPLLPLLILLRVTFATVVLTLIAFTGYAQTFRGAINGTVTDPSGAIVPGATVAARDKATGLEHATVTTSDGQFAIQDLPVGAYKVTVTVAGFPTYALDNVGITAGAIYTLLVKLSMQQQSTTVEVLAATLTLDTTTEIQTTLVTGTDMQQVPLNGRDFTGFYAAHRGDTWVWRILVQRVWFLERNARQPNQLADRRRR